MIDAPGENLGDCFLLSSDRWIAQTIQLIVGGFSDERGIKISSEKSLL